jgi:hypothetical protein
MAVVKGVVPMLLLVVRVVPMIMLLLLAMHVSCSSHVLILHDTISTRVEPSTPTSCLLLLVMVVVHLIVPSMVLLVLRMVRVVAVARSSSCCRRCMVRVVLLLVVQWVAPMRCRCKASTVTEPMGTCNTRVAVVVVLPALVGIVTAAMGAIRCVALVRSPCCCSSSLVCPPLVAAIHLTSGATIPQRCMVLRVVLLLLVVVPIASIQGGVAPIACSRCCCSVIPVRTHVLMLLRALLVKVKVTAAVAAIPGGCSRCSRRSAGRASCTTSAVGCRQLLVLDPTAAACKVMLLLLPLVVAAVEAAPDLDG